MRFHRPGLALAALALLATAACDKARPGKQAAGPTVTVPSGNGTDVTVSVASCTSCHGTLARSSAGADPLVAVAPPSDTRGATASAVVGAHLAHLTDGPLARAVACSSCHLVPASAKAHQKTPVAFSGLAIRGGTTPSYAADTLSCAATYCHGGFRDGDAGNRPLWTDGAAAAACGKCHGLPPGGGHPTVAANQNCKDCHPGYDGVRGGTITVNAALHVNGNIDLTGTACTLCHGDPPPPAPGSVTARSTHPANTHCSQCHPGFSDQDANPRTVNQTTHQNGQVDYVPLTCTTCHGDVARQPAALASAPPRDSTGATASAAVGAHQKHLASPAFSLAVDCAECHAGFIPAAGSELHANGTRNVAFGALARNGAVTPTWTAGTLTCTATYCHGNFRNGNLANLPTWGGSAACGSCHGTPANPAPGGSHPAVAAGSCGDCHPPMTGGLPDAATHLNGRIDLPSVSCTSCHGDPNRLAAPGADAPDGLGGLLVRASPPADASARTTGTQVGAHLAHVNQGAAAPPLSSPLACALCHAVPTGTSPAGLHQNGVADVVFSGFAAAPGATANTATGSCSATYCHGNFAGGNGAGTLSWTAAGKLGCASCHGAPPPASATSHHPQNPACGACHAGYGATSVAAANHVDGIVQHTPASGCTQCHGDLSASAVPSGDSRAAPGFAAGAGDSRGNTATALRGVGAHQRHLTAGTFRTQPIACAECHTVPADGDLTHANGTAQLAFGTLARTGGLSPRWNGAGGAQSTTCSNVYCHGGFTGGAGANPNWTRAGLNEVNCGSCHTLPPAVLKDGVTAHPARTDCASCHGPGYDAVAKTISGPALLTHINGVIDGGGHPAGWRNPDQHGLAAIRFDAGNTGLSACTVCHTSFGSAGSATSSCDGCHANPAAAPYNMAGFPTHPAWKTECTFCHGGVDSQTGAPPRDTSVIRGGATQLTSLPSVGAHTSHAGAGAAPTQTRHALAAALTCTACHPAVTDLTHADARPAEVTFGAAPGSYAGGSCAATWCHGNFNGGKGATPAWTGSFGAVATLNCSSCHDAPPALTAATHHPQNPNCAACHGAGFSASAVTGGAVAAHVDGTVTLTRSGCTLCHGNLALTGQTLAQANAAAPGFAAGSVDTQGRTATSAAGVGAHAAHLVAGRLRGPLACAECHLLPATDGDVGHATGPRATLSFGTLARTSGATASYDQAAGTCSNVYCHGTTLNHGGSNHAPTWTGGLPQAACGTCHGAPPPAPHVQDSACGNCHTGYSALAPQSVDLTKHINGTFDPPDQGCNTCHGTTGARTSYSTAAPPLDAHGGSQVSARGVGAHATHLRNDGRSHPVNCSDCHPAPGSDPRHNNAVTNPTQTPTVAFAGVAVTGGLTTAAYDRAGALGCSATYCHGNFKGGNGPAATPAWNGTAGLPLSCTGCHQSPPALPHPQDAACADCHGAGYAASAVTGSATVTHVDGSVTLLPGRTGCTACHGTGGRTVVAGGSALQVPAAPPMGTRGEQLATARAIGAHLTHVNGGSKPVACTECHAVVPAGADQTHADGATPIAIGALGRTGGIAGAAFNPGSLTCASTYCHGNFPRYGNAANTPTWTSAASGDCGSCHGQAAGNPLPAKATGHVQNAACAACHGPGYSLTTVSGTSHVNGQPDVVALTCTTCHGTPNRTPADLTADPNLSASPPSDTTGQGNTPAVGAHLAHVNMGRGATALVKPISCDTCHSPTPTLTLHANGTTSVAFAGVAVTGGITLASYDAALGCSATYCHGNFPGGKVNLPAWTAAGPLGCSSCHGNPPDAASGDPGHPKSTLCGNCHVGYSSTQVNLATHVNGTVDYQPLSCTSCHGNSGRLAVATAPDAGLVRAAPDADTLGNSATSFRGVGVHQAHVNSARSRAVACAECHFNNVPGPTEVLHANGVTLLAFGGLATQGGATASFAAAGNLSCSATYCHGSFAGGSGAGATPAWTTAGTLACTACHGAPPAVALKHPQNTACGSCHAGYGAAAVVAATHVDGQVTLDANRTGCVACHGDPTRLAAAGWTAGLVDPNLAAAPPLAASTANANAVGAHQAHLNHAQASAIRNPLSCADCHGTAPSPGDRTHVNGAVAMAWSALARQGVTPSYTAASGACANYCHGATLNAGGTNLAPLWSAGASNCTWCHGNPPPASAGHPQNSACAGCHGAGYSSSAVTGAALATHIDGNLNLTAAESCTTCHGQSRSGVAGADGSVAAAPPLDSHGLSASVAVGAHLAHVNQARTAPLSAPIACAVCHPVPGTNAHADGTTQAAFTGLAVTGNIVGAAYVGQGCNATYCHGNFAGGNGVGPSPLWNAGGAQLGCASCHQSPPAVASGHPQNAACATCHGAGYAAAAVTGGAVATHVDGTVQHTPASGCTQCHGDLTASAVASTDVRAAPGANANAVDTRGSAATATSQRGIGAHQKHLTGTTWRATPMACAECHVVPASGNTSHASSATATVTFGSLARNATWGGVTPSPAWAGAGGAAGLTCSGVYCHGSFKNGLNPSPTWATPSAVVCGSCHGLPPVGPGHPVVSATSCDGCHTGYTNGAVVNPATHLNGALDVLPLSCTSCHGTPGRPGDTLANPLAAAPPVGAAGQTQTTSRAVGAHQAHLSKTNFRSAAIACTDCHTVPGSTLHSNGTVEVPFGSLARAGGVTPSFGGTTCAVYCHGASLGGGSAAVAWTGSFTDSGTGTTLSCTSCHGNPPPAPHTASTACGNCHPTGYTQTSVVPASHINGTVELPNVNCSSCHGDPARAPVTTAGTLDALGGVLVRAAPPKDATGASPGRAGAHLAHVNQGDATGAGPLSNALACAPCHAVPTSTGHQNGLVEVAFTGLAAASGATFNAGAGSCASTYCHGNFPGGVNATPLWTGAAKLACTACHGSPPGPVSATVHHPQNPNCGSCHAGATSTTLTAAAVAVHVNGTVNRSPNASGCTGCHGDLTATGVANTDVRAAPGANASAADTKGNTAASAAGVGAHAAHLTGTRLRSAAIACSECHVVPAANDVTHAGSAQATLTFGTLARTGGATPGYVAGSCSASYCHGATLAAGGTNQAPSWTGGAAQAACGTCHATPPPAPHTTSTACAGCHGTGYDLTGISGTALATHLDGTLQAPVGGEPTSGGTNCGSCHAAIFASMTGGSPSRHFLGGGDAPVDAGASWVASGTLKASPNYANATCVSMCHGEHPHDLNSGTLVATHQNNLYADPSTSATRANGTATRTATNRASTDFDPTANDGMCAKCHSLPIAAGGFTITGASFGGSAHDFTSAAGVTWEYALHDGSKFRRNCTKCHASQAEGNAPSSTGTLTAVHGNPNADLLAGTKNPGASPGTFVCYNCHGNGTIGTNRSAKDVATRAGASFAHPVSSGTAHDTTAEAGATWNSGRFSGTNRHANCLDCHGPHAAGSVKSVRTATATATRNAIPAGSPLLGATGVTFGPTYPTLVTTACAANIDVPNTCVMQTTAANFGAAPVAATLEYQICFKCHTSYAFGATYPTASATGASGTKGTDLASEFSPTNRSGHPVVTGLNNYTGSTGTKALEAVQLLAPWNVNMGTQTMLCTDCHNTDAASPAAQGPHGSAVRFMLAGTNKAWPYTVAGATTGTLFRVNTSETGINTVNGLFCRNCHPSQSGGATVTNGLHVFANTSSHSGASSWPACVACHIRVPHGGKVSRLIITANAPTRYKTTGQNPTMTGFTKSARATYSRSVGWSNSCGTHGGTGTESW